MRATLVLAAFKQARGLDRVVVATAVLLAALVLAAPAQALESVRFTLDSLLAVAPYLALSVLLAAAISASGADRQLGRVLKGRPATVIFIAALFGALSPFCSVSVIPVVATLLRAGVPLAPIMAFWVGSPLMDPEMFILTAAVIDLPFAAARAVTAIAMGLIAGYATHLIARAPAIARPLADQIAERRLTNVWSGSSGFAREKEPPLAWAFWRERGRREMFVRQGLSIGWFLFKWLALAFLVESLMVAYIPAHVVAEELGHDRWWVIPASAGAGIPTYLNGYAAIPTISALLDMGMLPGAALAFLIAGEVTSIPTAMSVFVLVRRWVFAWYLFLGLAGSLAMGLAYQAFRALA